MEFRFLLAEVCILTLTFSVYKEKYQKIQICFSYSFLPFLSRHTACKGKLYGHPNSDYGKYEYGHILDKISKLLLPVNIQVIRTVGKLDKM